MAINQSISWWCFANRGVDDVTLLRKAKEIGYKAVELIGPDRFAMVQDAGMAISSHGGHGTISSGLNDPDHYDRIEREILSSLELAVKWKIPNLIVFSGDRRSGVSEREAAEICAAGLRRVSKAAEQANVTLVMELLNSRVDHAGYQCDRTEWGVEMCKMVDSPRVKLLYDIYHMQIMEGDLIRTIKNNQSFLAHYHTAGNPGRKDMDKEQEIYYPAVFAAIEETGYSGYVGHEFVPKGEPIAALKAAFDLTAGISDS